MITTLIFSNGHMMCTNIFSTRYKSICLKVTSADIFFNENLLSHFKFARHISLVLNVFKDYLIVILQVYNYALRFN